MVPNLKPFLISFFVFFLQLSIISESCLTNCGDQPINFPFQLRNQPNDQYRCGYPGFDLSCKNHSQTIITFPSSGHFSIELLDYYMQNIYVSDPAGCLAKRLLDGFDPSGTPFEQVYLKNFTLLNCSAAPPSTSLPLGVTPIPCLSGENGTSVVAIPVDLPDPSEPYWSCLKIATVSVSVPESVKTWEYLGDRIMLSWKEPDCKRCLINQGTCQYKKNTGLDIGCSVVLDQGTSIISRYFFLFAVVFFLFILGLAICIPATIKRYINSRRRTDGIEILQSTAVKKGLDGPTIEMYPTMLLGESKELQKLHHNTCSICLFEYQAKDTLRTIPSCMHYFHANCIDEWLKRNATCPLCRE